MPKKDQTVKIRLEPETDQDGKLKPPYWFSTKERLDNVEREVKGRSKAKKLTIAQQAECYRLLQAEYLLYCYGYRLST